MNPDPRHNVCSAAEETEEAAYADEAGAEAEDEEDDLEAFRRQFQEDAKGDDASGKGTRRGSGSFGLYLSALPPLPRLLLAG